jgi:RluA family pseudouridine synthase
MPSILFEDDDIIAVNKPGGLASIPERRREADNLLAQLSEQFPGKLYVVHRLDKEVSGVILFAKHAAAHKALNTQFSQRQVRKTYLALTHGVFEPDRDIIDAPIRQFGSGRMGVDQQRGKPSQTEFIVQERFYAATLLKMHPVTGRRHQIRVHLYHIGHPIVGDIRYGEKALQRQFPRVMLHATQIRFRVLSKEEKTIEAPLPELFTHVVRDFRDRI